MVSIYIIGSVARQAYDIISDKDMLAVGSPREIRKAISTYVEDGWNVSCFSRLDFEAMANSRSLFVQHVKQDGRVVRDDHGYLKSVLNQYKANSNYWSELRSAIEPIITLGKLSRDYWGLLFQADILYVATRNSCILHRATDASPEFDFKKLVQWIGGIVGLSAFEKERLLNLRSLKHSYRRRDTDADVSQVIEAAKIAKKLAVFWDALTHTTSSDKKPSNGYFEIRKLEEKLVNFVGPIYMDELDKRNELAEVWSAICNSGPYDKPKLECLPRWSEQVSDFLANHSFH